MAKLILLACSIVAALLLLQIGTIDCSSSSSSRLKEHMRERMRKQKIIEEEASPPNRMHYIIQYDQDYALIDVAPNATVNHWIAKSVYNANDYNKTGWSTIEIETHHMASNREQSYFAGFIEGYLTRDLIKLHALNANRYFCEDKSSQLCLKMLAFLDTNMQYMQQMIDENPLDPYWNHVSLALNQFYGLVSGYYYDKNTTRDLVHPSVAIAKLKNESVSTYYDLLAINLLPDSFDIKSSLQKTSNPFLKGHCSVLVKVLPDNADIFVAHDTWLFYTHLLRILKHYKFSYYLNDIDPVQAPGNEWVFSTYPGTLMSTDDFLLTGQQLAITETSLQNSNADIWKFVTPINNLYWIRVQVASRLSASNTDWAKWFSIHNSGTYNNQWMVLDYKKFSPGSQSLPDDLFVVLEQMPGAIMWQDETQVLRDKSYWSSYNIPYYPAMYNLSGTYDAYVKYGSYFSYENTSRALIFRRDHSTVNDMNSMIKMMRYNDFTRDTLSACECSPRPYAAELSISARCDLNAPNMKSPFNMFTHQAFGAIDMKLTSSSMIQEMNFVAISGPTHGMPNVPSFRWSISDLKDTTPHFGHPDLFEFEPYNTQWQF